MRGRVEDGEVGAGSHLDAPDVAAAQRQRAEPAVAAYSASPGVSPISRTARAMTNGIDEE